MSNFQASLCRGLASTHLHPSLNTLSSDSLAEIASYASLWDMARLFCCGDRILNAKFCARDGLFRLQDSSPFRCHFRLPNGFLQSLKGLKSLRLEYPLCSVKHELYACQSYSWTYLIESLVVHEAICCADSTSFAVLNMFPNLRFLSYNYDLRPNLPHNHILETDVKPRAVQLGMVEFSVTPHSVRTDWCDVAHLPAEFVPTVRASDPDSIKKGVIDLEDYCHQKCLRSFTYTHALALLYDPQIPIPASMTTFFVSARQFGKRVGANGDSQNATMFDFAMMLPPTLIDVGFGEVPFLASEPCDKLPWWNNVKKFSTVSSSTNFPPNIDTLKLLDSPDTTETDAFNAQLLPRSIKSLTINGKLSKEQAKNLPPSLTLLQMPWYLSIPFEDLPTSLTYLKHTEPANIHYGHRTSIPLLLRFPRSLRMYTNLADHYVRFDDKDIKDGYRGISKSGWTSAWTLISEDQLDAALDLVQRGYLHECMFHNWGAIRAACLKHSIKFLNFFEKRHWLPHFHTMEQTRPMFPEHVARNTLEPSLIHDAFTNANMEVVHWLSKHGFENLHISENIIFSAIKSNSIPMLSFIKARGCDFMAKGSYSWLSEAVAECSMSAAQFLISEGCTTISFRRIVMRAIKHRSGSCLDAILTLKQYPEIWKDILSQVSEGSMLAFQDQPFPISILSILDRLVDDFGLRFDNHFGSKSFLQAWTGLVFESQLIQGPCIKYRLIDRFVRHGLDYKTVIVDESSNKTLLQFANHHSDTDILATIISASPEPTKDTINFLKDNVSGNSDMFRRLTEWETDKTQLTLVYQKALGYNNNEQQPHVNVNEANAFSFPQSTSSYFSQRGVHNLQTPSNLPQVSPTSAPAQFKANNPPATKFGSVPSFSGSTPLSGKFGAGSGFGTSSFKRLTSPSNDSTSLPKTSFGTPAWTFSTNKDK